GRISVLIGELKEKGPLLAYGKMGPSAYRDSPSKLLHEKFNGLLDLYGWKPGALRKECQMSYALVVGAVEEKGKEYVYFVLTKDVTPSKESYLRMHRVFQEKIYKTSHKTFYEHLFDLYAPAGTISHLSASRTNREEFVQKLISLGTPDEILEKKKAECKKIGQDIFDHYKAQARGDSYVAKEELQSICEEVSKRSENGRLRMRHIEAAWDGVGDDTCRWMG
ncbi:MAG: hypothetical protein HYZ48_04845, partial [Chlamydiales bacterium]|nr:hypothetical protein [Chlamydiales bacterium]